MARHTQIALAAVLVAVLAPARSFGQADPFWLRSWNEAQRTRPQTMTSVGRIASAQEPGTPLVVHGLVLEPDGRTPAARVVVHAYHRDQKGFDFGPDDKALTTWRLQGWVKTDAQGRFEFKTIRPAPDHMGRDGPHIHFTVETQKYGRQWPHAIHFADDARVSDADRRRSTEMGQFGWVREVTVKDGIQHIDVNIRLKPTADF